MGDEPQGGGEPAIVLMGVALAIAIHHAVGVPVLQLPMTPERVKKALALRPHGSWDHAASSELIFRR